MPVGRSAVVPEMFFGVPRYAGLGNANFNGTIGVLDAGFAGALATPLLGAFRAGAALAASIVAASTTEDKVTAAILI